MEDRKVKMHQAEILKRAGYKQWEIAEQLGISDRMVRYYLSPKERREAAVFFLRKSERAQKMHQKLVSKYGKGKALSLIAQKLGRTVYYMLKHNTAFEPDRFFQHGIAEPLA